MKLKITLMHEPGEDKTLTYDLSGVTLSYPGRGHIVVHAKHVTLASDEYETLGSVNMVHAEGAAELIEAAPIDTKDAAQLTLDPGATDPATPEQAAQVAL